MIGGIMILINFVNGLIGRELFYLFALILRIFCVSVFVVWTFQKRLPLLLHAARIIVYIAGIYLILYVFYDMGILGAVPEKVVLGDSSMLLVPAHKYNFLYYSWSGTREYFGKTLPSASGFWREQGVTQIFYNFALLYFWFVNKKKSKLAYSIVLTAGILSTGSTMGYLILLGLIAVRLWRKNIWTLPVIFILIIPIIQFSFVVLSQRYGNIMASTRMINTMEAINLWRGSLLIGNGYSKDMTYWEGILNYFVHFGIFGSLPVWILVRSFLFGKNNFGMKTKIAFIGWWLASLMNEAVGYSMFFIMLYVLIVINYVSSENGLLLCTR